MDDAFAAAADKFEQSLGNDSAASPEAKTNQESNQAPVVAESSQRGDQQSSRQEVAHAIAELDKMDKFKLDGQEWTLKDLKAAIMRQKDYTQKTQGLAEERKSFDSERKFHEKLAWDLLAVRENPALAQEFIRVYPEKFHSHVEQFLKNQTQAQGSNQNVQQSQPDIQMLSRLDRLEKFYHEQEVVKNESQIKETMTELGAQYPRTQNPLVKEVILARAWELHQTGVELSKERWESIYKQVDQAVKGLAGQEYGEKVKQQTQANQKARGDGSGGGTAGRAPAKFKNFDEITKLALEEAGRS